MSTLGPCCNRSRVGRCRVPIGYRCRCNLVGCRIVCGRTTVPARHEAVTRRRERRQLFHAPQRRDMQYSVLRHGNAEHLGEQIGNDLPSQCAGVITSAPTAASACRAAQRQKRPVANRFIGHACYRGTPPMIPKGHDTTSTRRPMGGLRSVRVWELAGGGLTCSASSAGTEMRPSAPRRCTTG